MDNSNNQSWPPSQNPPDPSGASPTPPPPPVWPTPVQSNPSFPPVAETTYPTSSFQTPPIQPHAPAADPLAYPQTQTPTQPAQDTNFSWPPTTQLNPTPTPNTSFDSSAWQPLAQIDPLIPSVSNQYTDPSTAATSAPQAPSPLDNLYDTTPAAPPNTSPIDVPQSPLPDSNTNYIDPNVAAATIASTPSSLDNPYGAPIQPPPIDGGLQNPQPQPPPLPTEPAWSPPTPTEQAPTDLSHLISSSESNAQATTQPEAIVMPQTNTPDVPTIQTESKGGVPKWVVGLGVGLLIIVAGVSAYFILGIGQTPKNTSLPATEAPKVNQQENTPTPAPTSAPQTATESANFGELQGFQATPQASSAADILKARQQQSQ